MGLPGRQNFAQPKKCRQILIEKLSPNIKVGHLLQHFKLFGFIEDVYIEKYVGDTDSTKCGYVLFENSNSVDVVFWFGKHIILRDELLISVGYARVEVLGQLQRLSEADVEVYFSRFGDVREISQLVESKYSTDKVRVVTFSSEEVTMNLTTTHVIKGVAVNLRKFTIKYDFAHSVFIEKLDPNVIKKVLLATRTEPKSPTEMFCDALIKLYEDLNERDDGYTNHNRANLDVEENIEGSNIMEGTLCQDIGNNQNLEVKVGDYTFPKYEENERAKQTFYPNNSSSSHQNSRYPKKSTTKYRRSRDNQQNSLMKLPPFYSPNFNQNINSLGNNIYTVSPTNSSYYPQAYHGGKTPGSNSRNLENNQVCNNVKNPNSYDYYYKNHSNNTLNTHGKFSQERLHNAQESNSPTCFQNSPKTIPNLPNYSQTFESNLNYNFNVQTEGLLQYNGNNFGVYGNIPNVNTGFYPK